MSSKVSAKNINLETRTSIQQNQFNNLQLERNKNVLIMLQIVIFILLIASTTSASPLAHPHRHHHNSSSSSADPETSPESLAWKSNGYDTGSKYNDSRTTGNGIKSNHDAESDESSADFGPQDKEDEHESIEKIPTKCPQCKNSDTLSEDDLTKLRIEYVKKQILHKLRLTERPRPLKRSDLPEPVQVGYSIESDKNEEMFNRRPDGDYAKTTQKIVFMTQGWCVCFLAHL